MSANPLPDTYPATLARQAAELKQLERLWGQAQAGEPGVVALLGDVGSGKSTVLRQFMASCLAQQKPLPPLPANAPLVLWLTPDFSRPEPVSLLLNIIDCLTAWATQHVNDTYRRLQPLMTPLELPWGLPQFREALLQVFVSEDRGSPGTAPENLIYDQLMRAIRMDVPVVKKLTFSIKGPQTQLADAMLDPWLLVAAGLTGNLNGLPEALKAIMGEAESLKSQYLPTAQPSGSENFSVPFDPQVIDAWITVTVNLLDWIEETLCRVTAALQKRVQERVAEQRQAAARNRAESPGTEMSESPTQLVAPGLVLVLDQWEQIAALPTESRQLWKTCLCELLTRLCEAPGTARYRTASAHGTATLLRNSGQRTRGLLFALSCRTDRLSLALGPEDTEPFAIQWPDTRSHAHLFTAVRHKLLLGPKTLPLMLTGQNGANPVHATESRLEQDWRRFQLAASDHFSQSLALLWRILQEPCTHGVHGFTVARLIGALGLVDVPQTVFSLLHQLFTLGWITPLPELPAGVLSQKQQGDGPYYCFRGGPLRGFLHQKIPLWLATQQAVPQATTVPDTIAALPLALAAAELSPETTQSLLRHQASAETLEAIFCQAYASHGQLLQKLNILENWAVLPPGGAFISILGEALTEPAYPLLREYAARHLNRVFTQLHPQGVGQNAEGHAFFNEDTPEALNTVLKTVLTQLTESLTGPMPEDVTTNRVCKAAVLKAALPLFPQPCQKAFKLLLADPHPRIRKLAFEGVLSDESGETAFAWIQQGLADEAPFVCEAVLETLTHRMAALNAHKLPPYTATDAGFGQQQQENGAWAKGWQETLSLPALHAALWTVLDRVIEGSPVAFNPSALEWILELLLETGNCEPQALRVRLDRLFKNCIAPASDGLALKQLRASVQAVLHTATPQSQNAYPVYLDAFEAWMQTMLQGAGIAGGQAAVSPHTLWGILSLWDRMLAYAATFGGSFSVQRAIPNPELIRLLSGMANGQLVVGSGELGPLMAMAASKLLKRILPSSFPVSASSAALRNETSLMASCTS